MDDLARGGERVGDQHIAAKTHLEILGRKAKRVNDRFFFGVWRAGGVGLQPADALGVVDQLFLGHVLAIEHGPPFGLGLALVEIDKLTGKLPPLAVRFGLAAHQSCDQRGVPLFVLLPLGCACRIVSEDAGIRRGLGSEPRRLGWT